MTIFRLAMKKHDILKHNLSPNSKKDFAAVKKFYQESLAQLGWRELKSTDSELRFYRENDVLEIDKISISPLRIRIILKNRVF